MDDAFLQLSTRAMISARFAPLVAGLTWVLLVNVNAFLSIHSKIYLIINLASDFIMAMVMLFVMFYFFLFEMIKAHKKRIKEIIIYVCDIMETRTNFFVLLLCDDKSFKKKKHSKKHNFYSWLRDFFVYLNSWL